MARKIEPITLEQLTAVPANQVPWDDLDERELTHNDASMSTGTSGATGNHAAAKPHVAVLQRPRQLATS